MKQLNPFPHKNPFLKARNACFASYLLLGLAFFGTIKLTAQSTVEVTNPLNTSQKIIVYNDVPLQQNDLDYKLKSDRYKILVRILGTSTWYTVFTSKTYNKAGNAGLSDDTYPLGLQNPDVSTQNYLNFTGQWSHSYGNIEMTQNTSVEVKITKLDGNSANPLPIAITKVAAHPVQKIVGVPYVNAANGVTIFTINNPGQITIDFDGAMDDRNRGSSPLPTDANFGDPVHTVTLFANPIMAGKPPVKNLTNPDPTVLYVSPGTIPSSTLAAGVNTVYFMPGVHNLGINFKLYPGKQYYIPGDAIVYGTFNNLYLPTGTSTPTGKNIKVFGYGTISGGKQAHPRYSPQTTPGVANDESLYKGIVIENASSDDGIANPNIYGITIADPSNHATAIDYDKTTFKNLGTTIASKKPITFAKWVKIITWRGNGDGIGACQEVSDCFFRTNDDSGYIKGNKYRNIFWKDTNAAVFHMAGIPDGVYFPLKIEDCEVIYARSREIDGSGSGVFHLRGNGSASQTDCMYKIDLTVNRFKVSDPLSNMPVFNIFNQNSDGQGPMYNGMIFNYVDIKRPTLQYTTANPPVKIPTQKIFAYPTSCSTTSGVTTKLLTTVNFDNCTINGSALKKDDFDMSDVDEDNSTTNDRVKLIFTPASTARIGIKSKESNYTASGINVYSNANILNVNFPNADLSREIQIYNILGQMMYKTTIQNDNAKIDTKSLNLNGVVIVKVIAGDDVSSHKVLVQ